MAVGCSDDVANLLVLFCYLLKGDDRHLRLIVAIGAFVCD